MIKCDNIDVAKIAYIVARRKIGRLPWFAALDSCPRVRNGEADTQRLERRFCPGDFRTKDPPRPEIRVHGSGIKFNKLWHFRIFVIDSGRNAGGRGSSPG